MRNPALILLAHLLQILVLRLGTPASLTIWVCSILAPASSKAPNIPFLKFFYYRSLYVCQHFLSPRPFFKLCHGLCTHLVTIMVPCIRFIDDINYQTYPKRSSRRRLLRKDFRYYPYSSSRCLVLDYCQYFSCAARSCKPSCCQCYFLGRNYGTGFGLYYSHLLPKGIPQSPRCDV